jgi:nucleoid-associated protein YgaU
MKRILTWSVMLGLVLAMVGCQNMQKKETSESEDKMALQNVQPENDAKAEAPQPTEEVAPVPEQPAGGRIHVVQKGETLYKLARQYYNDDQSQWRKIYQANQAQIPNPDQLKVGQQLVIP